MSAAKCIECSNPINPEQDFRQVSGWERIKSRSRTVSMIDRTSEVCLCRWCLEKLERGLSIGQKVMGHAST